MDYDAQKLQVRLVGRDGRRRYDPASRDQQLVAACLEPGVSVSRLALAHGVNANLVRKWMKKAKEERPLSLVSAFVPVQISPAIHTSSVGGQLTKTKPCFETALGPGTGSCEKHRGRFIKQPSEMIVASSRDMAVIIDFPGLVSPGC